MTYYCKYPLYVTFCITPDCNASCLHCSSNGGGKKNSRLNTSRILNIISELANCGVFRISFSGGEPLIHPDFFKIAEHATDCNLTFGIGSNGILINELVIDRLKKTNLSHVQISLDGSTAEIHDVIRGVPGLFYKAINAIKMLISHNIRTHVCMTPMRLNYMDFENVILLCDSLGVNAFNLSQYVPIGRGNRTHDLSPIEWKSILLTWKKYKDKYDDHMDFYSHEAQEILVDPCLKYKDAYIGCQAGIYNCCIKSDGVVTPCVMLDYPIGDLTNNSFKDVWIGNPVLEELRDRSLYKGKCSECNNLLKCGGCRGYAYSYTNDLFSEDPRCWR